MITQQGCNTVRVKMSCQERTEGNEEGRSSSRQEEGKREGEKRAGKERDARGREG